MILLYIGLLSKGYMELLSRLRDRIGKVGEKREVRRMELPEPDVVMVGNRTVLRNFMDYPRILRRDPGRLLMYMARNLATAASRDGERAIFIGRKDPRTIMGVLNRYIRDGVLCQACGSWDTKLVKEKRLTFILCEACGARSPARVD